MYEVTIRKTFSAAHILKEKDGTLEDLHGHNFIVEATVSGEALNREELLIDFRVFKKWINDALDRLDHKFLNHLDDFREVYPSSERLAKWIYDQIAPLAVSQGLCLARVTVWESEDARVSYEDRSPI
jgi:6-pyruvoyltetrahydropterin/6-carboxytetrahydropterin synthase